MNDKVTKMLATFFYAGYFPVGAGTFTSAIGVVIWLFVGWNIWLQIAAIALVTYLGFRVSGPMEKMIGQKDPGVIVIDEVAGVLIAFFMLPPTLPVILTAFFLFRAFDMFKIYPVNKFEEYEGGFGIMTDDIVAGIYTNIVMQIAGRWAGII